MKLPSLSYLAHHARISFLRFKFTIISGLVAAGLGIYLIERHEDISNIFPYINVMLLGQASSLAEDDALYYYCDGK